ncbi:MAG TPA: PQQ-binding-like beta-propeller repeat protein [Gammaproteobacteria bacterium]|nr:PQQ-binding-like beta-propeller repeat protein [Gammaproteobacteria bacterium]
MGRKHLFATLGLGLALAACSRGGDRAPPAPEPLGALGDANPAADRVAESARRGAPVGLTITAPEIAARGGVVFSLANDASGAFAVDSASGVVTIAAGVDFEVSATRTIAAHAASADLRYFADRDFTIEIIDSPAPVITIDFPFTYASYAYSTAAVSGRVTHPDLASIDVSARAGAIAVQGTVRPDGRFFVKDIPVEGDSLVITVTAAHAGKDTDTESVTLGREPALSAVESMILDAKRNRFLYADRYSATLVAAARDGYVRTVVSGSGRGAGPAFAAPVDLALDTQGDRIYVVDAEAAAVFRVDPATGDRSIVSAASGVGLRVGTGPTVLGATALVYDTTRSRLLLADDGRKQLLAVDPSTGDRVALSANGLGLGPPISFWTSLGLDAPRDRVIAVSGNTDEVFAIDLATGARTLLSDRSADPPNLPRFFRGISVAPSLAVAYLADDFSNAVMRLDLATGARVSVTSSGLVADGGTHPIVGAGPRLEWPTDLVFDEAQSRLYLMEQDFSDPLLEVHLGNGDRERLTDASVGAGVNFRDPKGIALDAGANVAYVVDNIADVVVAVDLTDGSRRLIAGPPDGRGTIATDPLGLALDRGGNQVYVADFTENSLYAIDLTSGARRNVSDQNRGAGVQFVNPVDVGVDATSGTAYVLDRGLDALLAVDLASGDRSTVLAALTDPAGLLLDAANRRAFVADAGADAVVRIDLATGARTTFSASGIGTGPLFGEMGRLTLDAAHGRLLVLDSFPSRIVAVDLATGNRTVLSGQSSGSASPTIGGGPIFLQPGAIAVDEQREIAFVTENLYDAVIAVDLSSGFRQIVSR